MKTLSRFSVILMVFLSIILLSSCSKNNTPSDTPDTPDTPGTGGQKIMYPSAMTVSDGGNTAPYVYKYVYNANNLLIRWGMDSSVYEVSEHGVNWTSYNYPYETLTSYAYKVAYQQDTSASIYTGTPSQCSIDNFRKNVMYSTVVSRHDGDYFRAYSGNLLIKEIPSDPSVQNVNYFYDDNKNLKSIEWVNQTGPRTLAAATRLTVVALDDKASPFVSVLGYRVASWPQFNSIDYCFAYCHNNPTQVKVESYDATKNEMVLSEQDDFAYTYNENGYPTTIVLNTTFYGATVTRYVRTYSFTYK